MFKLGKPVVFSERDKKSLTIVLSLNNRVINVWNSLPDNIVAVSSISSFKRNVKRNGFDLTRFLLF
jgi:hypothetical protein